MIQRHSPVPRRSDAVLMTPTWTIDKPPKRRCSSFGYPPCSAFLAGDHQGLLCASCLWRRAEAIVEKGRDRA